MKDIEQYLIKKNKDRVEAGNFRELTYFDNAIDFTSNDYLGFAKNEIIKLAIAEKEKNFPLGSTGSRLLSGNSELVEQLEIKIAAFHKSESALLFSSGFLANYGLLSTVPSKDDLIIYDEYVHASIIDGIRASKANVVKFAHNDIEDLQKKLQENGKIKFVVIESLYSMDGDFAPLHRIVNCCKQNNVALIVDEAHAIGVYGENGAGLVVESELVQHCFARIATYGKAIGAHGAAILGSENLMQFLVNYCRPFIFSTALAYYSVLHIEAAYDYLPNAEKERIALDENIFYFKQLAKKNPAISLIASQSAIQSIVLGSNEKAVALANFLQAKNIDARAIRYPTVPLGTERIRLCLHSYNTKNEIDFLIQTINEYVQQT